MTIEKFPEHYSFQNFPTAYDEEGLTALELCGRLGHKINEVITAVNGWNVPEIIHVSPSGDKTGYFDRAIIQGKLDAGYAVQLEPGEYYLKGPLMFQPGYMLRGESQLKTVINCEAGFIDHAADVSVDHIEVRDVRVKGPGTGVGIDISRKLSDVETGGRYAHFMNVYLSGYNTGVVMGGCWCVNFTHCRIEGESICVEQRGGCNHIKYDHCMFLGPVDKKTSTALKIHAEGGAENYGISVDHCDFERHHTAIHAYCCVSLNVTAIYAEGCTDIFNLDSCPGFLCSGGYISFPDIVLRGNRSNALPLYEKSGGSIRDVFIRVNTSSRWAMMSTPDTFPVKTENITVKNDGAGDCYANAQLYSSIYNGVSSMQEYTMAYDVDATTYPSYLFFPNVMGKTLDFKTIRMEIMPHANFTLTEKQAITWGNLVITLHPGTYERYVPITNSHVAESIGTDYAGLITNKNTLDVINFAVPVLGANVRITLHGAYGKMVL